MLCSSLLLLSLTWALAQCMVHPELLPEQDPPPLERQMKPSDLPKMSVGTIYDCHPRDVDLFFVVDNSGSIGTSNFATLKSFMQNIVNQLVTTGDTRSRVGVVEFNAQANLVFNLLRYDNVPPFIINSGIATMSDTKLQTNIASGMTLATDSFTPGLGDRPSSPNMMIVITDGHDNTDVESAHAAAAAKDIKVIAIGIGDDVSQSELLKITGGDASLVIDIGSFNNLSQIINITCQELNPCDGDPCLHGGTCVPTSNGLSYSCICPSGWSGPICNIPAIPCDSDPCQNGGTCLNENDDYKCICPPGYYTKDCSDPWCYNGGTFECHCDFGWEGPQCKAPVDFCNDTEILHDGSIVPLNICGPHGTCHNTQNGIYCTCQAGWTGPYCDQDIDDCVSNPCLNGGTCENLLGPGYKCECPFLFIGKNCGQIPDFCSDMEILGKNGEKEKVKICGEHGTCFNGPEGARCLCDHGWTGKFCQTEIPYNCTYTDSQGQSHVYPHDTYWIDDCNQCICKYGVVTCSKSFWCPHKCAWYATAKTQADNIPVGCPAHENCILEDVQCAAPDPTCDYPVGWCFPAGHILIDTITIPTNPPNGWQTPS